MTSLRLAPVLLLSALLLSALALPLACSAGVEDGTCTAILLDGVSGTVFDSAGDAIVPDRVFLLHQGVSSACRISVDPPRYACRESVGEARVIAFVGARTVERELTLESEARGCHAVPQRVDLLLQD